MYPAWNTQTAVITGAGSVGGIGFAVARRLHAAGVFLAITSTTERIQERARELDPNGRRVVAFVADLTVEAEARRLIESVMARTGRILSLIHI